LQYERVTSSAFAPLSVTYGSAGYDLKAAYDVELTGVITMVSTDLVFKFPEGYYGRVCGRSGMALNFNVHVIPGVLDPDYRGVCSVLMYHTSEAKSPYKVSRGDRVAQLVIEKFAKPPILEMIGLHVPFTGSFIGSERGGNGFGSTGK